MAEFFLWYGIIWLIGLVGLPFSFALFARLPDRGYAFSRPLGLWLLSMLAWWLGNLQLLPFVGSLCWYLLALLAVLSTLVWWLKRHEFVDWFSRGANLRWVLAGEALFFAAYAFMVNFRSFLPALNRSEKFFDFAFINAMVMSPTLPPPDPWFGGVTMNYYYGGQLYMAVLSKLSRTPPSTGYNVGMGLVYAMAVMGCFGLGSNLFGLVRQWKKASNSDSDPEIKTQELKGRVSLIGGLLGAAFIMILGNIDALRQFVTHGLSNIAERKFPPYFDWPASARMVYDYMPDGRKLDILTEYPIYSFLNGDLHAHLLDLPYVVLALAFILNMFIGPGRWVLGKFSLGSFALNLAGGLILGAPFLINGGDFPTYLGLALVALTVAELRAEGLWRERVARLAIGAVRLVFLLVLVYLPYFLNFNGMLKGTPIEDVADKPIIGWLSRYIGRVSWPGTFLAEYVTMFGLFLFSIVVLVALSLLQIWRKGNVTGLKTISGPARWLVTIAGLALLTLSVLGLGRMYSDALERNLTLTSSLVTLMSLPVAAIALWPGAWASAQVTQARQRLLIEAMLFLSLLGLGPVLNCELLGPALALLYFALKLGWSSWRRSADDRLALLDSFCFLLVALAAFLTLFVEFFYIRDIYTNRFNTMFKFWYQIWMLYGLAAVYATWRVFNWRRVTFETSAKPELVSRPKTPAISSHPIPDFNPLPHLRPDLATNTNTMSYQAGENSSFVVAPRGTLLGRSQERWRKRLWTERWRWAWVAGLVFLAVVALACPTLGYWEATDHYSSREGLNGEAWYAQTLSAEYPAMVWLRNLVQQNPDKRGIVLEANGMNYSWYDRISTYTGLPTIVGWPFHELQWRAAMDDLIIWEAWLDMDRIYATTDNTKAIELLKRHNVRYVFVGELENGTVTNENVHDRKHYSPEALAKFASFMQTVYADPINHIYIYAFY